MAPPPRQSQPGAPTELSRKEALGLAQHQQEHEKTRKGNLKIRVNSQMDITKVGSSSGPDSSSLGMRSPEPEARVSLGGAELQRPPKFFHEDNGLKGLAGPPPAPISYESAKEDNGKKNIFLRFFKREDKNLLPNHDSHFSKAETTGAILMDDTTCHQELEKGDGKCGPALENTTEKTEDGAAVVLEVKTEVLKVTEKDWNDAIHNAVRWTVESKIKPALANPANAEQIEGIPESLAADIASTKCQAGEQCALELELTEAEIASQAEEMVKAYYAEHPQAKADVLTALCKLANEQRAFGDTAEMPQLVQEAAHIDDAAGHRNTRRSVHEVVNEYGKGRNHWKPKKLELWEEAGFDGYPPPPEIDLEEAKMQAAACEALHGAPITTDDNHRIAPSLKWDAALKEVEKHAFLSLDTIMKNAMPEQPSREAPSPPPPASMNLDKRNNIPDEARPCIIKSGIRSGNCAGTLERNDIEKGVLDGQGVPASKNKHPTSLSHTAVNRWGKGKAHYHPEAKHTPKEQNQEECAEGSVRSSEDGFVEGSVDPNQVGTEPADIDALFQCGATEAEPLLQDQEAQPGEPPEQQKPQQDQHSAHPIEYDEWTKGIDKHDENEGVPEESITKRTVETGNHVGFQKGDLDWQGVPVGEYEHIAHLHRVVNKWGKGKNHYHLELEKEPLPEKGEEEGGIRLPEDGFVEGSVDPNDVGTEPADPDALFQNVAPEPQPQQRPKHRFENQEWTKGIDKHDENDGVPEVPVKRDLHELVNEYGKGAKHYKPCHLDPADECGFTGYGPTEPIDLEEAAMQAPADEALLRSNIESPCRADDISAIHRLPPAKEGPEIDLDQAKMQAVADANLLHDRVEKAKEEDKHVKGNEWMKGIGKHDENNGALEESSRAIPRHIKRAPIDVEGWITDGQDEADVNFSQHLDDPRSDKHHKDKDGHHHNKGDKHHSKSHHLSSAAHHSKSSHATSAAHSKATGSIHTRSFSAPARAPGHALPTSRMGGYKFSQAAGRSLAAATAPATSIKGHMHGAKPTHTAAVSGKTTAAPTQKHAEPAENGSVKHVKIDIAGSSTHAQAMNAPNSKAAETAATAGNFKHITNHREPVDDDYRALDRFNAATLNSVGPNSSTAQLLAESEKVAAELNHGTAKSNTDRMNTGSRGNKLKKRAEGNPDGHLDIVINPRNDFDGDKMTAMRKPRNKSWHLHQKNFESHVEKAQENDMYRVASEIGQENGHESKVISQQEPIIRGHELAAIQASNGHAKGEGTWWGRFKHDLHNNEGLKLGEENEKENEKEKKKKKKKKNGIENSSRHKPIFNQMGDSRVEHEGPKAKIWVEDKDKFESAYMNLGNVKKEERSKLGKRHSHIPQVKEEEDAKMRGYASSSHLAGAAAKKDRQKAAEKVNEIARNLEEDREALHAAAEHRADRLMAQAEKEENAAAKKGKEKEYLDHDTYDPTKAYIAEDKEEKEDDDREGSWIDVVGGELVEHNHHDSGNEFAQYKLKLGSASATGVPSVRGTIVDKASEMSDLSMVLVIGVWIAILFAILKLARKKTEGETAWLKGRRSRSGRAEETYLEDIEEGGVEKRYD